MTRLRLVLVLAFFGTANAGTHSQDAITGCLPLMVEDGASSQPPSFGDYPAAEKSLSDPAPVDLTSHPLAPRFRTRLREAAARGPNFAGHYTIASWGCGSGCIQHAIVDRRDGRAFFPPQVQFVEVMRVAEPERLSPGDGQRRYFRRDSELLIVVGRPLSGRPLDRKEEGIFYFRWSGTALELVRFLRSDKRWCRDRTGVPQ